MHHLHFCWQFSSLTNWSPLCLLTQLFFVLLFPGLIRTYCSANTHRWVGLVHVLVVFSHSQASAGLPLPLVIASLLQFVGLGELYLVCVTNLQVRDESISHALLAITTMQNEGCCTCCRPEHLVNPKNQHCHSKGCGQVFAHLSYPGSSISSNT